MGEYADEKIQVENAIALSSLRVGSCRHEPEHPSPRIDSMSIQRPLHFPRFHQQLHFDVV